MKILHTGEIWKWIVGYKDHYKVSSYGRIKSVERRAVHSRGGTQIVRERILIQSTAQNGGYPSVVLSKNGTRSNKKVHHLVLEAFVGPCPKGMECCHKDDNPQNNHIDNLYWGTHKQNWEDAVKNGRKMVGSFLNTPRGENHGRCKLSDKQVNQIRKIWEERKEKYGLKTHLAKLFGVTGVHINYLIERKSRI